MTEAEKEKVKALRWEVETAQKPYNFMAVDREDLKFLLDLIDRLGEVRQ
jgi:hypothetical protein